MRHGKKRKVVIFRTDKNVSRTQLVMKAKGNGFIDSRRNSPDIYQVPDVAKKWAKMLRVLK